MLSSMRVTILLVIIGMLTVEALAQTPPDAAEILKKVGETYRAAKEFELVSTSTGTAVPGRVVWAFRAPSQFRLEGADPNLDRADGSFDQTVLVRDGSSAWWYHPRTNEYAAFTSDQLPDKGNPETFVALAIGRFREADSSSGRFLRQETLEINSARVPCYVVSLPVTVPEAGTSIHTWWIEEKSSHIVRDDDDEGSSVVFATVKLDEPLPNDLFRFVPPPGAHKLDGK
jgi:outer membrane lipoprotein-sorting protein